MGASPAQHPCGAPRPGPSMSCCLLRAGLTAPCTSRRSLCPMKGGERSFNDRRPTLAAPSLAGPRRLSGGAGLPEPLGQGQLPAAWDSPLWRTPGRPRPAHPGCPGPCCPGGARRRASHRCRAVRPDVGAAPPPGPRRSRIQAAFRRTYLCVREAACVRDGGVGGGGTGHTEGPTTSHLSQQGPS